MVKLHHLTKLLHEWWKQQFEVANIQTKIDPSLPENIYGSFDGIAFDGEKVWVRSSNRDHILWLDNPPEKIVFYELFPFSNVTMFPSDFKENRIDECKLLSEYIENKWQGSEFFTLPFNIELNTQSFRGVDYSGIEISNYSKKALTKEGEFNCDSLYDWRKNISRHLRSFCEEYEYKPHHDDKRPKEEAGSNPHWPYRPSIENGFVRFLERTTKDKLLKEIEEEEKRGKYRKIRKNR
jgi:hypothetical protein